MAVRSCERVTVTRLVVTEGEGHSADPVREVTYWCEDDGNVIARHDPCANLVMDKLIGSTEG